jgi:8-oxo-dGTP pyrophosphatase MutT (NUDIX family)
VEAAVFDDDGRILLLQRSDDSLWAMPGGLQEMGETSAEGAVRETREETGYDVEVVDLLGLYDSRLCGTRASIQLLHVVFRCRLLGGSPEAITTPGESLAIDWFAEDGLPPLSAGHTVRVPEAFAFRHQQVASARFDRP